MAALAGPHGEGPQRAGWGQEQLLGLGSADATEVLAAKGRPRGPHTSPAPSEPCPPRARPQRPTPRR